MADGLQCGDRLHQLTQLYHLWAVPKGLYRKWCNIIWPARPRRIECAEGNGLNGAYPVSQGTRHGFL